MKKRGLLFIGLLIILSSFVFAAQQDCSNNQYPYSDDPFTAATHLPFNETSGIIGVASIGNNSKIFNAGSYGWIPGYIGNALSISGGTNINMNWTDNMYVNNSWAISFWILSNDTADKNWLGKSDGSHGWWLWEFDTNLWLSITDGAAETVFNWNGAGHAIADNARHHVIINKRASNGTTGTTNFDLYIDGIIQTAKTTNSNNYKANDSMTQIWFGNYKDVGGDFDAIFDEVMFYDHDLTTSQIFTLNCTNYTAGGGAPPAETFSITATDQFDGSSLNNISTVIDGTIYATNNGTLYVNQIINASKQLNFTIRCNDSGGYFNKTYKNYNLSANLAATLFQSVLRLNATEKISLKNISSGLFYDNTTFTSNGSNTYIYLKAGTYNFTFVHSDYFNKSQLFTVSALDNITGTLTGVYNAILNVTAIYLVNGSAIPTFSSNITNLNGTGSYYESNSTSSGLIQFFVLKNYKYNVSFDTAAYELDFVQVNLTTTYAVQQFTVYSRNSFNFTIRDEITDTIIDKNFTIEFISDSGSYNYTAYHGTLYVDLIVPADYTIRYQHDDYGLLREYYYTLTNRSHNEVDLYALDNLNSSTITVTVYDELNLLPLENTMVYLQRYYLASNTYKTVAMYSTNVAGNAYFDVELNNELYKFLVDSPWKTRRLTTEELYISSTTINLYISTRAAIANNFFNEEGILGTLDYNNETRTFTATWADSENTASQFCLYIKTYGRYGKSTLNSSCSTDSSGSISLTGLTIDKTNYAIFTATVEGEEKTLKTLWADYYSDELDAGPQGAWFTSLIFIALAFLSTFHILAALLAVLALVFSKLIGIFPLDWGYILIIVLLTIIVAILLAMKRR